MRGFRTTAIAVTVTVGGWMLSGCGHARAQTRTAAAEAVEVAQGRLTRHLRLGGTTVAVHSFTVRIPQIPGQSSQFVLIAIIPNGAHVNKGDVLAEFDDYAEVQNALNAKAKFDDFSHQVDDTRAQNAANKEQRASDLQQAESDLAKAKLELKKTPILSAIDAQTDQLNLEDAQDHVADLTKEDAQKDIADAASLRVLELERDQQQVEWQRAQSTVAALTIHAPLAGMVGLVPVFRQNSQGPAQPGDQLYSGQSLLRIFDPGDMEVVGQVNQADAATLEPGLSGTLRLDAYPDIHLPVSFLNASPVAVSSGFDNPLRFFSVTFHVDGRDPRLLPDLSAAIDLAIPSTAPEILVPRAAIHFVDQQPYVTKRTRTGGWTEQAVALGNYDDKEVAVLQGLAAGDQVRIPETAAP